MISQFKLTTPYDVSTLSLEGTFDVSSVIEGRELVFSNDGSKMFIIDDSPWMLVTIKFMNLT